MAGAGGRSTNSETPVNERPLGLCRPTERSSPYSIDNLKVAVFGKFENARIYVNSDELIPSRVWYMPRFGTEEATCPAEGKHYEVVQVLSDGKPSVGQYLPKWMEKRKGKRMLKMSSLFEEVGKFLKWNDSAMSWHKVPCPETSQSDNKSDDESDDESGDASDYSSDDYDSYYSASSYLTDKLEDQFPVHYFILALIQNMVSSEGRHAVSMLVQCACTIVFGPDFTKESKVGIYNVGSSNARCESFPVEVIFGARRSNDVVSYDRRSRRSVATDSNVSNVSGTGLVLADIVVASGHKPNWPRFLLVGEIRSEALNQKCMSQLVREAVAPLMHQSEVFGLLINDQEAKIVQLQHKFNEKIITMKTSGYSFVNHTVQQFSTSEMNRFFVDLVAVLDYGKKKIKEIYHGF